MAAFKFKVNHPEYGDYYTGTIAAEDASEARDLVQQKLEDKYDDYKDRDDRTAVPVDGSKVTVSEVKNDG